MSSVKGPTIHPLGFIGEAEGIDTGILPRRWDFEPGEVMEGHAHGCPHATLIASGRFLFTDERMGTTREVEAMTWIPVAAKDLHGFTCLERGVIFCVFSGPGAGERMSWVAALNFRISAAFVTDGAGETCIRGDLGTGSDEVPVYPFSVDGLTLGYPTAFVASPRNRNSGVDRRLAGVHFCAFAGLPAALRLDLPAAGDYIINAAFGDFYGAHDNSVVAIEDDTTPLFAIDHTTGWTTGGQPWRDATDTLHSAATWVAASANGGASRTVTFFSTICRIRLGSATGLRDGFISHFRIEQVEASTRRFILSSPA